MTRRQDVVRLARSLIERKVRFRPYGRNPDYGMDCIGIVIWIGWELGVKPRDCRIPTYSFPPSIDHFELITDFLVTTHEVQPGTIIVFTTTDKLPRHIGIVSHRREDGVWKMIGSIPGTLAIGEFGLLPGLTNNIWAMFDYPDVA
jgi:hypothetical protein